MCEKYIAYLKKRYPYSRTIVIFDGYSQDSTNTGIKSFERRRRSHKYVISLIKFDELMNVTVLQESFLSNKKKQRTFHRNFPQKTWSCRLQNRSSFWGCRPFDSGESCKKIYGTRVGNHHWWRHRPAGVAYCSCS